MTDVKSILKKSGTVQGQRPSIAQRPFKSAVAPPTPKNDAVDDNDDNSDDEYVTPNSCESPRVIDLAKLVSQTANFPVCVKTVRGGDVLMIHCMVEIREVLALDSSGKQHRLPLYAKQRYHMLPIDPRLDDKVYNGTSSLFSASPLPAAVRVVEGYYSDDEDETKEVDDIIIIKGIDKRSQDTMLIGVIAGEAVCYKNIRDTAVYTTMIAPDPLPLSDIIKHKLPMRVRTFTDDGTGKSTKGEIVLNLKSIIDKESVLVTRSNDGAIFPLTPSSNISVEVITPVWTSIPALVRPLHPYVNTSLSLAEGSKATLPREAMRATPQPMKKVLDVWLKSHEGMSLIHEDALATQKKLSELQKELERAKTELKTLQGNQSPVPIPPRPQRPTPSMPGSPAAQGGPGSGVQGGLVHMTVSTSKSSPTPPVPTRPNELDNTSLNWGSEYDEINIKRSSQPTGLASTDLEKLLKNLLEAKTLELQTRTAELEALQKKYKALERDLKQEKQKALTAMQQLEAQTDMEDCYDVMTPSLVSSLKGSTTKERHVPLASPAFSQRVDRSQMNQLPARIKAPTSPLPTVPRSPETQVVKPKQLSKRPGEYNPPLRLPVSPADGAYSHAGTTPTGSSPVGRNKPSPKSPSLPPPSSLPLSHPNYPMPGQRTLSRQTDSYKHSMASTTSSEDPFKHTKTSQARFEGPFKPNTLTLSTTTTGQEKSRNLWSQSSEDDDSLAYESPYTSDDYEVPTSPASCRPRLLSPLSPSDDYNPVLYATPDSNIAKFTKENVATLLSSLNLDDCVDRFLAECVDGVLLMSIDEEMMINELGMTRFEARKLTIKIDELTSN